MKRTLVLVMCAMVAASVSASGYRAGTPANVNIVGPISAGGNLDVEINDQHTRTGDIFFSQRIGTNLSLQAEAALDAWEITMPTGHGILVGEQLVMFDAVAGRLYIGNALTTNANTVTLDTPINHTYPVASSAVVRSTKEMNVDGSSNRQTFSIEPPIDIEIDVTRIMFQIICEDPPAFDDFGDIEDGLVRGVVLRVVNGINVNYFNVKTNGELVNLMFDVSFYDQTGPQGVNGIGGRLTYGGRSKHGAVIRLGEGDTLEAIVQDDLTTQTQFRMMATFHEVSP